jgi:hypothetical protein
LGKGITIRSTEQLRLGIGDEMVPRGYTYYYYYYYYVLHLSAKCYEELLAIRLRKPFMDKTLDTLPMLLSYALLLTYGCSYYHVLYLL